MSVPPRLDDVPTPEAIAQALGRLATNAVMTWWILEKGRLLLGLDSVRSRVPTGAQGEKAYAVALRNYLNEAVARVESPQYRTILEVVLGIGDERWSNKAWRREKAKARRREAGRRFRPDEAGVPPDTIRQHHEPRAINALAHVIWQEESEARREALDRQHEQEDFTHTGP